MHVFKRLAFVLALLTLLLTCPAINGHSADGPLEKTGPMSILGPMDLVRLVQRAKGKPIIFNFWASWCGPCRSEIPELNKLAKRFSSEELLLAGFSVDEDPAAYSKFVAETEFEYPVRRITDSVARLYRIGTIPRLIVYNAKGEMVVSHEGVVNAEVLTELVEKLIAEGKQ